MRQRILLTAASLALAWATLLAVGGGVDLNLLGISVTSNDARRPFLVGLVLLAVWAALSGRDAWVRRGRATARSLDVAARAIERVPAWLPVAAATAATVWLGFAYGTSTAGGSDSYGYVSEAELWIRGDLVVEQPWVSDVPWPQGDWTFSPLGYRPSDVQPAALVPTYPAGLPLLMALAKIVAGQPGMFWIGPIAAGILIMATFGLGRRIAGDGAGAIAACLVATSPTVLFMSMQPMSDVPAAAAMTVAFWGVARRTSAAALTGGLAGSAAVLLRPNLALLMAALVAWLAMSFVSEPAARRLTRRCAIAFVVGLAPGAIAVGLIHWSLYGSPFMSGYGDVSSLFSWDHIPHNVRWYFSSFIETQTALPLAGAVALCIPARRLWPAMPGRFHVLTLGAFTVGLWCFYLRYILIDAWWYLRFVLPSWPLIMLGFSQLALRATRALAPIARVAVVAVLVALCVGRALDAASERLTFTVGDGEDKYVRVARMVAASTEPDAVVLSMLHSGSIRYYGGRLTMRYDMLDPAWLERSVSWMRERDVHAYLLLEQGEFMDFVARYGPAGQEVLAADPVAVYHGDTQIYLFDLWGPPPGDPVTFPRSSAGPRYALPAPDPFPGFGG